MRGTAGTMRHGANFRIATADQALKCRGRFSRGPNINSMWESCGKLKADAWSPFFLAARRGFFTALAWQLRKSQMSALVRKVFLGVGFADPEIAPQTSANPNSLLLARAG